MNGMNSYFNEHTYITQTQQKRLPRAHDRLTDASTHVMEHTLYLVCFFQFFTGPSFLK